MKKLILILLLSTAPAAQAQNFLASEAATQWIMDNLKITGHSVPRVSRLELRTEGASDVVKMELSFEQMPSIQLKLRGPQGFLQRQDHAFRTLFLATGFFTGSDSTLLLGDIPGVVFVGFDYPFLVSELGADPSKLLQSFRLTPGQMALSLKWLSQQAWMDSSQLVVMGVSLGGLFLPAALHIAQKMDVSVGHTIFAFTGADTNTILANNLRSQVPEEVLPLILTAVSSVNTLNDPELHLPFLAGPFLVVYSDADQIIPRATSERLFALLPAAKDQVVLQGPHIDIDRPDLIQKTKDAVLNWLK